jgi:hypothetical protein
LKNSSKESNTNKLSDSTSLIGLEESIGFRPAKVSQKVVLPNNVVRPIDQSLSNTLYESLLKEIDGRKPAVRCDDFNRFGSSLVVKGKSGINFKPYNTRNVAEESIVQAPLDLVAARRYIVAFTVLTHLGIDNSSKVKNYKIFDFDSRGEVEYFFGANNIVFNNFHNVNANNKATIKRVLNCSYQRHGASFKNFCCNCSGVSGRLCSHFADFKPDFVVMSHPETYITDSTFVNILSSGVPIIYVGHLFSELTDNGEYGQGRWREAIWKRCAGKILFNVLGKKAYFHKEYFNYMRYTHNYSGKYFGITKAIDLDYGSFNHVGLILDPLRSVETDPAYFLDFKNAMSLEELMAFKYDNGWAKEQVVIMDKEATLTDVANVIAKDGGVAFIPSKDDKNVEHPTLLKNIRGTIHFCEFTNKDLSVMGYILGLKNKRYSQSFFSEYFGLHKFSDEEHMFKVSLEKYNSLVSELLISEIDEDALYFHVAQCLKSHFKFTSDPVLPVLLIKSVVIDVTRITAAIKGLQSSSAFKMYRDVYTAKNFNSIGSKIRDVLFDGNKTIDPQKYMDSDKLFGITLNSKIYMPDFDVIALPPRLAEQQSKWMAINNKDCATIVTLIALILNLDLEEEDEIYQDDYNAVLEYLVNSVETDDAEMAAMIRLIANGSQPTKTALQEVLSGIAGNYNWVEIVGDKLDHGGSEGPTIIFSRGHVEFATGPLIIGESL